MAIFVWAAIAIGVIIALVLIFKYTKSSPNDAVMISTHCKICGYKTNGLKCPKCSGV